MELGNPSVSIIVPCYNQGQFLSDALDSVLSQSFNNWECIIINDGSFDYSEDVALEYLKRDCRFRYYKTDNKGVSAARNFGISKADGNFILPLDADDYISADYISEAVNILRLDLNIKVVYSRAIYFGSSNDEMHLEDYSFDKLLKKNLIFVSGLFRKDDFIAVGGYNEKMLYGLEDWDFWLALLGAGGKAHKINKIHFYYRIKNESRNSIVLANYEKELLMRKELFIRNMDSFLSYAGFHDPCYAITEMKRVITLYENSKYLKIKNRFKRLFNISLLIRKSNN